MILHQENMKHNIIVSSNEKDIWSLIVKARHGYTVRLLGVGNSMRPFLKGGRDYINLVAVDRNTKLCKYDIVLYKSHDQHYVIHRIYSVSENGFFMLGDGNLTIEPLVRRDHIYLKATGFLRNGKYVSMNSKGYKGCVLLWMKLYPFRRQLLRLYQRFLKAKAILEKEKAMKIKEDLMLRNINEDWIVIPMGERLIEFNGMMKMNQSGSFIWKQLELQKSREEIISALLEEYDIDQKTASQELDAFVKSLIEANILEA